jgi:hypothetical protein
VRPIFAKVAVAAALLAAWPAVTEAQPGPRAGPPDWRLTPSYGVGYMGSAPRALLGAMGYVITPALGGIGLFVDARLTHKSYEDDQLWEPNITAAQAVSVFGDFYVQTLEHWRAVRVGAIRPLTADLAIFAGAGYADGRIYGEYFDESLERGLVGTYRARDEAGSGGRVSFTGGAMFRFGHNLAFQFGLDSAPRGFSAGASLLFQ